MTPEQEYALALAAWLAEQVARDAFLATLSPIERYFASRLWPLRPRPLPPDKKNVSTIKDGTDFIRSA